MKFWVVGLVAALLLTACDGSNLSGEAKSTEVAQWSNGFPSGEHFNLNIHGKKADYQCDATSGGGSVFVPEYGDTQIQYVQNKRSSLAQLSVLDPCGMTDAAKVQLPAGEYQVYARILAKPNRDGERKVVFYPKLIDACDDTGEANFGNFTDCSDSEIVGIGKVTSGGVFDRDSQELVRLPGQSKAVEITEMFQWSGWVCDAAFDVDGDGAITAGDVTDLNGDGIIDDADVQLYLAANCEQFTNEWIFNIADLVVYGWDYQNTGSKLVQVRFYPKATTTYT